MRIKQFEELRSRIGAPGYEAYKAEVLSGEGLVLALFFDEGRGDRVIDASGKGNHGTIYGATWTRRNRIWALSFDGVDDYVDCGNDASIRLQQYYSVELWMKPARIIPNQPGSTGYILAAESSTGNGFTLRLDYNAIRVEAIGDGALQTGGVISLLDWYHIAWTRNGDTSRIYVNGELEAEGSLNFIDTSNRVLINAGGWGGFWSAPFNGLIDEVRIYNRALSNDEIARHWQLGLPFHPA